MKERDRLALHEERLAIYGRDRGICQWCKLRVPIDQFQVAHRIANTIANRKRWGAAIIDHRLNKATAHPECNSYLNIGNKPMECIKLRDEILKAENHDRFKFRE